MIKMCLIAVFVGMIALKLESKLGETIEFDEEEREVKDVKVGGWSNVDLSHIDRYDRIDRFIKLSLLMLAEPNSKLVSVAVQVVAGFNWMLHYDHEGRRYEIRVFENIGGELEFTDFRVSGD